jgi:hypothetical protein
MQLSRSGLITSSASAAAAIAATWAVIDHYRLAT